MADVSSMAAALKAKQQASQTTTNSTEAPEIPVPSFNFGQNFPVEATSGLPILPGSDYGPPKPVSPSDKFGVGNSLEETNLVNAIPNFIGNILHQGLGIVTGLTSLGGKIVHDVAKGVAAIIPGEQGLDRDTWHTWDEFFVPMVGWGDAESVMIQDWKYRYGLTELGEGNIVGALGKIGRGIFEQPLSLVNDALMVGGAVGVGAKAIASSAEMGAATRVLGAEKVASIAKEAADIAKAAATNPEIAGLKPTALTAAEQTALNAAREPWHLRAMRIAAVEPGEIVGQLRPKTTRIPIGIGDNWHSVQLRSNPVARMVRASIWENPLVSATFGTYDKRLRALTGGVGYDKIVERIYGGAQGWGKGVDPDLEAAFAGLEDATGEASRIFRKMQRMVENQYDPSPSSIQYEKVFRPYVDRLYESKMFGEIRSTIGANAVERRKRLTTQLGDAADKYYKRLDEAMGEAVPRVEANRLAINIAQGTIGPEGIGMLQHELSRLKVKAGTGTHYPMWEPRDYVSGTAPAMPEFPPEWRIVNDAMPEGIPAAARPHDWDSVMVPIREAVLTVKRGLKERIGLPDTRVAERSITLPTGGARKVVNILVDTIEDIPRVIERVSKALGGEVAYVYDTLRNPLTREQELVRTVIAGIRRQDGSIIEIHPGTPDILTMADSNSVLYEIYEGLIRQRDDYFGVVGDLSDGRIGMEQARIVAKQEHIQRIKDAISNPELDPKNLPNLIKQRKIHEGLLDDMEIEHARTLEDAQAAWEEVEASMEFGLGMNEGVNRILKEGNNYHPALRLKDEIDNTWWREVLAKEVGADAQHPASMTFRTMMRRKYAVQRVTESVRMFNRMGDDLYRFLNGDFVKDIMRMTSDEQLAFANRLNLPKTVRFAMASGDEATISRYFSGLGPDGDVTKVIASRIAAFLHMNDWPSEAVEQVLSDFFADHNFKKPPGSIANVRSRLETMKLNEDIQGKTGGAVVTPLNRSATFHGEAIWQNSKTYDPALLAHAFKEYAYQKVGHLFEKGDVEGWGWSDFHTKWKYEKGMPTPSYYPHVAPPAPGSKVMALGSRLSSIHGRDTWLHEWDGELLKRGIYEQDFFEAYSHKAVQLIRHQEIHDLYEKAKKFARVVSPRELDLFDRNWMVGERVWNPDLVDAAFRLSRQARAMVFDAVGRGKSFDEASREMLRKLTPDMVTEAMRASSGELYAIPTHIADEIERVARLNLGWKVRVFWDSPMQVWRSSVLALSPRWIINNIFGNAFFQMIKNPEGLWQSIRMFDEDYRAMWQHLSGGMFPAGVDRGLFFEQGNILEAGQYGYAEGAAPNITKLMRETMQTGPAKRLSRMAEAMRGIQGIVEDNFRRGTFAAESKSIIKKTVMAQGSEWFKSAKAMEHLMENGITEEVAKAALARVNATLGNYTNLNHLERQIIRRFVAPFYAFYRHSAKFLISMPIENAYKVGILRNLDQIDQEMYGDDMPDWFRGSVLIGKIANKDPLWLRTRNWNPLEGLKPSPTGLVGSSNPIIRMLFEQMTGISSFSGEKFTSPDTFETPTGQLYRYLSDERGNVTGVQLLGDNERVKPAWIETFASMFPQYTLLQRGILDPLQGESGAQYSTGGTIMENGTPKYPNPWWSAWSAYFGFPTTTFDPNEYLYKQYKDYWRTGVPMATNRAQQQIQGGMQ